MTKLSEQVYRREILFELAEVESAVPQYRRAVGHVPGGLEVDDVTQRIADDHDWEVTVTGSPEDDSGARFEVSGVRVLD